MEWVGGNLRCEVLGRENGWIVQGLPHGRNGEGLLWVADQVVEREQGMGFSTPERRLHLDNGRALPSRQPAVHVPDRLCQILREVRMRKEDIRLAVLGPRRSSVHTAKGRREQRLVDRRGILERVVRLAHLLSDRQLARPCGLNANRRRRLLDPGVLVDAKNVVANALDRRSLGQRRRREDLRYCVEGLCCIVGEEVAGAWVRPGPRSPTSYSGRPR